MNKETLSDKQKRINWDLTNELHFDDGKQYGGCPILFHYSDVREAIKELLNNFDDTGVCGDDDLNRLAKKVFGEELTK